MGKLRNLPPRVGLIAPRVQRRTDAHGHDPVSEPWRDWYKSKAWGELRVRVFQRDGYACQLCALVTERPIADHRIDHRGDEALFWDEANVQTLCKPCHDGPKQREEYWRRRVGG